jgi:hypothetical protein
MALRFRLSDGLSGAIQRGAFAVGCIGAILVARPVASGQSDPAERRWVSGGSHRTLSSNRGL